MGMITIVQALAVFICGLAALSSITFFRRFRWPAAGLWIIKLVISANSPWLFLTGVLTILLSIVTGSAIAGFLGMYVAAAFFIHMFQVTRHPGTGFEYALSLNGYNRMLTGQQAYFLQSRRIIKLPAVPQPRLKQNIPFATLPGEGRNLLCDLWLPPEKVPASGLIFIYLHGSAWYLLDKDVGTRPLFRRLAAQGHVVMDVAYRLVPETDMMGMVHDVKRAIHWIKENAARYQVNARQIVVGGGSAGAHLALMAAYTSGNSEFTPVDLRGKALDVDAVVSLYGPTDLEKMYYHTNQHLTTRSRPERKKKSVPAKMPAWMLKAMGKNAARLGMDKDFTKVGALATILGGHPDECPGTYALFSPVSHVHEGCPPTLIIQGEQDCMVPVDSAKLLYNWLRQKEVKSVLHILPQVDHAFDLPLPWFSPAAHNAMYDIERFLALQLKPAGEAVDIPGGNKNQPTIFPLKAVPQIT